MIDKNEIFREVTQRICGSLDIQQALESTRKYLKNFIPMDLMVLGNGDLEVGFVNCIAISNNQLGLNPKKKTYLSPAAHQAMKEGGKLYPGDPICTINNDLGKAVNLVEHEVLNIGSEAKLSSIVLTLPIDKEIQGVVNIIKHGTNQFSASHAEILRSLHKPFAMAMSNHRRYETVLEMKEFLESENKQLVKELNHIYDNEIIGSSGGLKQVITMTHQVSKLDSPVLLLGETGVGKEVLANEIHHQSDRRDKPFVKVNCGAIPENLIDSELFGHEKGAFTGATSLKKGRFERAAGGTIFLDEIGELPLAAQVRLLRVIQNGEIERVGGTQTIHVDVRIISATHRNLEEMVKENQFREDLWYRINVFPIRIPPLRQRKEDILELIHFFIKRKSTELKIFPIPELAKGEGEYLINLPWKGNVRELENMVERALIMIRGQKESSQLVFSRAKSLLLQDQKQEIVGTEVSFNKKLLPMDQMQIQHIQSALKQTQGRIHGEGGAADILKMNPQTLRSKMRKLGIPFKGRSENKRNE